MEKLLDNLLQQTRQPDEIIIVDAGEDKVELLTDRYADKFSDIKYYHTAKGLTRQRNFGIDRADGDIIGFFDDDVILDPDYLMEIITAFHGNDQVGGATGYIYPDQDQGTFLSRTYMKLVDLSWGQARLARFYKMPLVPKLPFDGIVPVRSIIGNNMFFRRLVFDKYRFGEWFEEYSYGEDCEFGLRISHDWKIVAVGGARLHHYHDLSGRVSYKKLATMSIYNFVRILTVARKDKIFLNSILLIAGQLTGNLVTALLCLVRGKLKDSYGLIAGSFQGLAKVTVFLFSYYKNGLGKSI